MVLELRFDRLMLVYHPFSFCGLFILFVVLCNALTKPASMGRCNVGNSLKTPVWCAKPYDLKKCLVSLSTVYKEFLLKWVWSPNVDLLYNTII